VTHHRLPFTEWSQRLAPGSDVLRNSDPHAVLLDHNLVAITSDPDRAHDVARSLERVQPDHALLTTIVYGDAGRRDPDHTVDPEGVTAHAGRRSLLGAIPGAIVGAVVIGLGVWLATDSTTGAIAAAVGGALFGAAVAAVWSFVIGTGQSEAFLDTFVDAEAADVTVIAVHADDPERIDDAVEALDGVLDTRVLRVDGDGHTHPEAGQDAGQPTRRSRPSQ
jgi:hypothetical protein